MVDERRNFEEGTMRRVTSAGPASGWLSLRTRVLGCAVGLLLAAMCQMAVTPVQAYTGINLWEVQTSNTQAGGHPDVLLHPVFDTQFLDGYLGDENYPEANPLPGTCCDDARNIDMHFPTGFIGNPHVIPKCSLAELALRSCPTDTQVGVVVALFGYIGLYNMETHPDEAGLVAFQTPGVNVPSFVTLEARTESDYGLDANSSDIFHYIGVPEVKIHIWGVPADSSHDAARLPSPSPSPFGCLLSEARYPDGCFVPIASNVPPAPYLQNPTTCGVSLSAGVGITYYSNVIVHANSPWPSTTGCDQLSFNPSLTALPTTSQADTASGLDVDLKVPQPQSPTVPSPSELRATTVTLPEGFSINPTAADGKTSCSDAEGAFGTRAAAQCPEHAKIGTLQIDSSALPGPIDGAIYLGMPLPDDTYRLFLTADGFATHVKLAGSVHPDPDTGQMVVSFEDLPQAPFQRFSMHLFGSERGILATPTHCGTYPVKSEFVPWDDVLPTQTSTAYFTIDSGPNGSPCPDANRPFNPQLKAGAADNTAGLHSPFGLKLNREDGDQILSGLNVVTPPGFSAVLKGIPYCSEATLSALQSSSGAGELLSSACPVASQIGTAEAGAGAGTHPLYTPGKVFLAGPYKGSPLSLAVVIPAVSGPYDLGNVVVRAAIFVNPTSAQVTTVSDPLPQILEGIPLRVRSILVNLDRPNFALNPTNCDPFSTGTQVFGAEGARAAPFAHFQVANCAALDFSPKLGIKLLGATKRTGNPALRAVLRAAPGEANLSRTVVAMPRALLLDNAHIGTVCTRVQFAADACPAASVYGQAEATTPLLDQPLKGSVYLRSSDHELPDLVVSLGGQFEIELVGRIDTAASGGLRASFETIPDAPVSQFVLSMEGGTKGLLTNSEDICKAPKKAAVQIVGQNGGLLNRKTRLQTSCGKAARGKRVHRAGKAG